MTDPGAFSTVERHFLPVHRKEVLAEELTKVGEERSETANNREIVADCIFVLAAINDVQHNDGDESEQDQERDKRGKDVEDSCKQRGKRVHLFFS